MELVTKVITITTVEVVKFGDDTPTDTSQPKTRVPTPVLAGSAIGSILGLFALISGVLLILRRSSRRRNHTDSECNPQPFVLTHASDSDMCDPRDDTIKHRHIRVSDTKHSFHKKKAGFPSSSPPMESAAGLWMPVSYERTLPSTPSEHSFESDGMGRTPVFASIPDDTVMPSANAMYPIAAASPTPFVLHTADGRLAVRIGQITYDGAIEIPPSYRSSSPVYSEATFESDTDEIGIAI